MVEVWKEIEGSDGYMVSNLGAVRSPLKILRNIISKGYLVVSIYYNGKRFTKKVHRLVAEAFISNPENLPVVNHKDFNKTNNTPSNLEWCTVEYNTRHANEARVSVKKGLDLEKSLTIYTYKILNVKGGRKKVCSAFNISTATYDKIASGKNKNWLYKSLSGGIKL